MIPRCIIWAAVSTPEQAKDDKESIPAQIEQAREAIRQRGWQEVTEPLVVPGQSRYVNWLDQATAEMPQMKALIEMAEQAKIDLVIVRDWDRLARTESLRVQISTRLREQGVQVYSLNQPVEPSEHPTKATDTALIVEGMTGIMAEMENRLRARRWAMGMLGRIKRGSWPWRVAPFGYTREPGSESLDIDPDAADSVKTIYRVCQEGKSTRHIARYLNLLGKRPLHSDIWFASSILRILRNPSYLGLIPFRGKTYPGQHEAIIDERSWNEVQAVLDRRRNFGGRAAGSDRLLIGLLRCGHCAGSMTSRKVKGYIYYRCVRNLDSGNVTCRSNLHPETALIDALMSTIGQHAQDEKALSEMLVQQDSRDKTQLQRERESILDTLSQMEKRRSRQWLAYEKGEITLDEFAESRLALKEEESELQTALASIEHSLARRISKDSLKEALGRLAASWKSYERKSLKAALAKLIEAMAVYDDGRLEITYRQ